MFPFNDLQDTSLFMFSDNICTNLGSTNQDFSSSSFINVFPFHLADFNDETMFCQDFHEDLHQKVNVQEMVVDEDASNTNMGKTADDVYSNENSNVKKKRVSSGGFTKLHEQIRVNRRCKKDRHSKITTANGSSRGRRIRLSLNVAKEFFGLQDLLKFDKASKTVEWLLKKSENAIKEETTKRLSGMNHSPGPSTSVLSATDELEPEAPRKEKTRGGTQKVGASQHFTRKLREKARERARVRTLEKKRLQLVGGNFADNDRSRLYNCLQGMNVRDDFADNECYYPARVLEVEDLLNNSKQQPDSFQGGTNTEELIIDHSFFISNNWNPYTMFNLHHNSGTTL